MISQIMVDKFNGKQITHNDLTVPICEYVIPPMSIVFARCQITGIDEGDGSSCAFEYKISCKTDVNNNATIIGDATKSYFAIDGAIFGVDIFSSIAGGTALVIGVKGVNDRTIHWVANMEIAVNTLTEEEIP